MTAERIPVVLVTRAGTERAIGIASNMDSAHRLMAELQPLYGTRGRSLYVDCARTPEEVNA